MVEYEFVFFSGVAEGLRSGPIHQMLVVSEQASVMARFHRGVRVGSVRVVLLKVFVFKRVILTELYFIND